MVANEVSPEDDATSNHATNNCNVLDPPSDLQTTHDVVKKYFNEVQPSPISWKHLAKSFSCCKNGASQPLMTT